MKSIPPPLPAFVTPITSLCSLIGYIVYLNMGEFAILTNRKRALVALAHSIVFLLIACRQTIAPSPAFGIWAPQRVSTATWILFAIFAIVSAILLWLLVISRGWIEKLYFGMCAASATSGWLRTTAGDQFFHAGLYVRVAMLTSAVFVGVVIVRRHSFNAPALDDSGFVPQSMAERAAAEIEPL